MQTIKHLDSLHYETLQAESQPLHHVLSIEIAERLKEMDRHGPILINRLLRIQRFDHRAYNLVLDLLTDQETLSRSLESLAAEDLNRSGKPTTRQNKFQSLKAICERITEYWPEVGNALSVLIERRKES